ncbi:RNA polymerase sigma factor SigX [Paraliobacillus sp. PM-2]|uniref:RNA polymerase sigma factor SigX n=1 Tax=Paraliobacillus sp. PM-2 TaxID=1462524 RepID=UPI00061C3B38|nr:RNA polymerase sigma factor SigX [Paraliobacillus sp. PM-2]CQR46724.1 RNA polymerase sigma factor SigX [Paraliobacillus sp. PM-2]
MKTAFESLYDNYHHDLFQYIFYMVKDRSQTEDIIQEVYIKVLKSYNTFRGDSSEKTWLFSIARHTTLDFFRKQKRKRNRLIDFFSKETEEQTLPDQNALPEEIVMLNDEMQRIYHKLNECNADQKQVIILRYIQSFSIQETADIMGWTVSKVKTTQHRAIKKLQALLYDS